MSLLKEWNTVCKKIWQSKFAGTNTVLAEPSMLKITCKLIHIVLLHAHKMTQNAKQSFVLLHLLPYS